MKMSKLMTEKCFYPEVSPEAFAFYREKDTIQIYERDKNNKGHGNFDAASYSVFSILFPTRYK